MGEHDLLGKARFTQVGHIFYIDLHRRDDVQTDPVEGNVSTLGQDGLMVFDIFGIGDMADHDFLGIGALLKKEFGLFHTTGSGPSGVGDDGHTGGHLGNHRGLVDIFFIGGHLWDWCRP